MKKEKKKKNWKKIGAIVAIVVVVFAIIQVIGYYNYIGYFLKGNSSEYSVKKSAENSDSSLKGKNVIFLGSSVTEGSNAHKESMADFLAKIDGVNVTKEAVSGTTLVDTGAKSYIQRMLNNLDVNQSADAFVVQLSTNDATKGFELGEMAEGTDLESFDTSTITGSMEYIIAYVESIWNCPVVFYTGSYYDSTEYDAMVTRLYELQKKWGIEIIDLWTDESFNDIAEDDYSLYMYNKIHPTRAGYKIWWLPKFEEKLTEILG